MRAPAILAKIQEQFEKYRQRNRNSGFRAVPCLVDLAAASIADDLDRFEDYHGSDNSEEPKLCAFIVYWMSKVKPIAIQLFHTHTSQITINESFAFFALALTILGIDGKRISNDFLEDFIYSLYYRDTSPRQMFFVFEMLKRLNQAIPGDGIII
jgi:hypothetical protein